MTDEQFELYQIYLRELADTLLLKDWEVELFREPVKAENAWASIQVMYTENYAAVYLKWPAFFTLSAEEQRVILVHELMHIHLERMHQVLEDLLDMYDDQQALHFAVQQHRRANEICNHNLARIFAMCAPLPPVSHGN